MVNRALTGELGAWRVKVPDQVAAKRPAPPPWSRIRPADVERFERLRAAAAAQVEAS